MKNMFEYQLQTLLMQSQQLHNMAMAISDAMEYAPNNPGTYCESVKLLERLMEEHSAKLFKLVGMIEAGEETH